MEFTDEAVVLLRQNFREADRMVCLYTRGHGRINIRFSGVNKPAAKMRALSEPFVHGNYRIYVRRGAAIGCATGGKVDNVFQNIRKDLHKTRLALHFCELFFRLTPEYQPNEEKFDLLVSSLKAVDGYQVNSAFSPAFILRLMNLAGFGMDKPALGIPEEFWHIMHNTPLQDLRFAAPDELVFLNKTSYICRRFLNKYLSSPLNTLKEEDSSLNPEIILTNRDKVLV
ncbi:DNA repair protein RecO (recombination protein O) [Parelusimicrobium proximum]|uniref:DNA repair protein RecO n=1 Tax=Parelusimicrobium proximum TaxID=3228953 RepID=UPI003D16F2CD